MPESLSLKREIQRKYIHFSSAIIPIVILIIGKEKSLAILGIVTPIFIVFDFLKSRISLFDKLYHTFFGLITREEEFKSLTGASFVLFGCLITLMMFPLHSAVFGMLVMSLCDSIAAIIGKSKGKVSLFGKTLEGTIGFVLTGLILVLILPFVSPLLGILAVISASIIELLPYPKINDNFSIPIVSAAILNINSI